MKYRVDFRTIATVTITVEADDQATAIEAACDEIPSEVCAHCSGWGQSWFLELNEWQLNDSPEFPAVVLVGMDESS